LYIGAANLDAACNVLDGNNGWPSAIQDSSYHAALEAFLGLYVYPCRPFGGTIATSVSESYDFLWERIGGMRKQADRAVQTNPASSDAGPLTSFGVHKFSLKSALRPGLPSA
jgi:hypothetical protein